MHRAPTALLLGGVVFFFYASRVWGVEGVFHSPLFYELSYSFFVSLLADGGARLRPLKERLEIDFISSLDNDIRNFTGCNRSTNRA